MKIHVCDEYKNKAENACMRALKAEGLRPTKTGWPDFLAFSEVGTVKRIVEVKRSSNAPLKVSQIMVMAALKNAGFHVQRFDPESGFTDFDEQHELDRREKLKRRR